MWLIPTLLPGTGPHVQMLPNDHSESFRSGVSSSPGIFLPVNQNWHLLRSFQGFFLASNSAFSHTCVSHRCLGNFLPGWIWKPSPCLSLCTGSPAVCLAQTTANQMLHEERSSDRTEWLLWLQHINHISSTDCQSDSILHISPLECFLIIIRIRIQTGSREGSRLKWLGQALANGGSWLKRIHLLRCCQLGGAGREVSLLLLWGSCSPGLIFCFNGGWGCLCEIRRCPQAFSTGDPPGFWASPGRPCPRDPRAPLCAAFN